MIRPPTLRQAAGWAFDLAALYMAVTLRLEGWPRHPPNRVSLDVPDWWWQWGTLHDTILAGPDAGAWATNIQAATEGQVLDIHRLPGYTFASAALVDFFGDVVFAGHIVNHLVSLAVVALTYLFGRATSGRAAALAGALIVAVSPELVENSLLFGVDPGTQFVAMLLIVTTWMAAAGHWLWIPVAGAAMGLAAGTHYLALVFVAPALVLLLLARRRWWARLLGVVVAAGVGWTLFRWMLTPYPHLSLAQIVSIYVEGVSGSGGRDLGTSLTPTQTADLLLSRLDGALTMSVARGLTGLSLGSVPWGALVGLFWLGVLGPGLRRDPRGRLGWDWRPAVWFVGFLAPLLALELARAPDRYGLYARPLLFLAVARGAASLGAGVDALIGRYTGRWPRGLVAFLPAWLLVSGLAEPLQSLQNLYPPTEKGIVLRKAGDFTREYFGPGGGVATFNRDYAFYTGRRSCMNAPCQGDTPAVLGQCLERMRLDCPGSGDLPYVIEVRDRRGFGDQPNAALDTLIDERFEKVEDFVSQEITLNIYAIDRTQLKALARELAGSEGLPTGVPPPPVDLRPK